MLGAGRMTHDRRRRRGLIALVLTASALIPAALAFACNPQAYLTLDRGAYAPGDSVRVSGSFFRGDANITVSIDRTGQSATVRTSGNGSFATTFALPASAPAGGYTVSAIGYEANGDVIPGLPARASFSVRTSQASSTPTAPASSGGGGQPAAAPQTSSAPAQTAAPQASPRPAARPSTGRAPAFREPTVFSEPNVQSSGLGRGGSGTGGGVTGGERGGSGGGGSTGGDRATFGGRTVFGGSVAPSVVTAGPAAAAAPVTTAAAGRSAATGSRRAAAQVSRQSAAQTAAEDVWSAQESGTSPSVLASAGDGVAVSGQRAGSQLTLGLVLLGAGALALIGMAAGETRRRRVRAR